MFKRLIIAAAALLICLMLCSSVARHVGGEPVIIDEGTLELGDAGTAGSLSISDGSSNALTIGAPALAGDWALTLPDDDGTAGQVLSTNGSGVCDWIAAGGGNPYEIIDADADTTAFVDDGVPSDADQFVVELAGTQRLLMSGTNITFGASAVASFLTTGITWNSSAADCNFVAYGDTMSDLFWVDAGLDRVGIGTNGPAFLLDVDGTFSANSINVNSAYTLPTTDGTANYVLTTDGAGAVSWAAAGAGSSYWSRTGTDLEPATDGDDVVLTNGETIGISSAVASNEVVFFSVTSDANARLSIEADGRLNWGSGAAAADVELARASAGLLELADGDGLRLHEYVELAEVTAGDVLTAASGYARVHILGDGRAYCIDDGGNRHDLTILNDVTLQGQNLARATAVTWDSGDTQNQSAAVGATGHYNFNYPVANAGHGAWQWQARRAQRSPDFAQAWLATGGEIDYRGGDAIKIRALVYVDCQLVSGSAPAGGSYWDTIEFYVNEQAGASAGVSTDLQSQTVNGAWRIIEADFDVSSWVTGDDDGLMFGIYAAGVDVDDPDPEPVNEWQYSFVIAWIEAIQWL